MNRKSILFAALLTLITFVSFADVSSANDGFAVGKTLENFKLPDTNSKMQSFNDLKGTKGAIIVFLSAQCPVVKGYNDRINQLAADYKAKGINFIGINSNSTESLADIKTHAAANYKFPVLIDKGNVLADQLGATVTPEIFYFNAENVLMYEGAIDNDRRGDNPTENYVRVALDSGISGKAISKQSAKAFGCSIKRAE